MRTLLLRALLAYHFRSPFTKPLEYIMTVEITHGAWEGCDGCGTYVRAVWCYRKGAQHLDFCEHHHKKITVAEKSGETVAGTGFVWYPLTTEALEAFLGKPQKEATND